MEPARSGHSDIGSEPAQNLDVDSNLPFIHVDPMLIGFTKTASTSSASSEGVCATLALAGFLSDFASEGSRRPEDAVKARRECANYDHQANQTRDDEQRKLRPHRPFVTLAKRTHESTQNAVLIPPGRMLHRPKLTR